MRVIKNPEERRQEILRAAIQVFARKGYDKTSISDIAAESGISQGLCYRYYTSKEEIYDAAIEEYADFIVRENLNHYDYQGKTLKEMVYLMSGQHMASVVKEKGQQDMFQLFHKAENRKLHDQLFLLVGRKLVPIITGFLEEAKARGEIQLTDLEAVAYFIVFGQIGMLMNQSLGQEERTRRIQASLIELLNL